LTSHTADQTSLDLVSIGRISVDLYGEQIGADLSSASTFRRFIGGSAGNIAVGTSRLGLRTAMIARLGDDGFGDYLVAELGREGVDTTGVVRDPERSTGTIVLAMHERTDFPRSFLVQDPSEFSLDADDVDTDLIRGASAVVLTGTLLSRPGLAAAARRAIESAAAAGARVVFDIDYRPAFWGVVPRTQGENLRAVTPEVTEKLQTVLGSCDVVVGTEAEICALGGSPDVRQSLRIIRSLTSATIVFKVGPEGAYAIEGEIPDDLSAATFSPGFKVQVVNSVGAGDAFLSGFLRGYLRGEGLSTALRWGNAAGAMVVGRLGCSGDSPSKDELDDFLARAVTADRPGPAVSSASPLHFDTATRHRMRDELFVFAIDHRGHLERIAAAHRDGGRTLADFKRLALEAFLDHCDPDTAGVLIDDIYVDPDVREAIADRGIWSARALELSGLAPVQFGGEGDVADFVRAWPRERVVKVLMVTSPGQDPAVQFANEERLARLSRVCRNLERDLLVEILPTPGHRNSADDVAAVMERWYDVGIMPAWWKLPAAGSEAGWERLDRVAQERDPGCRGFLLLGGGTTRDALGDSFRDAAAVRTVRGFALGRPLFHDAAEQWFSGGSSAEAAAMILSRYDDAVALWRASR
jgi:5-dehydro-2-deoxygluconokinase